MIEPLNDVSSVTALLTFARLAASRRSTALHVFGRVVSLPRGVVGALPFRARQLRMRRAGVVQVVAVHVGIHRDAGAVQRLMIGGARQRGEEEELQEIDRQLFLDDLDVVSNGFDSVVRETGDVTGVGDDAGLLPGEQHLAILGDLVLPFLRAGQAVGIDILEPDEDALSPPRFCTS